MSAHPLLLVSNIPCRYHAHDLRTFFSTHVEAEAFHIFHFRHRPQDADSHGDDDKKGSTDDGLMCCYVRAENEVWAKVVLEFYNDMRYTDADLNSLDVKCSIKRLDDGDQRYANMKELRIPPEMMPRGNVGTPTAFFLQAVQECRLPLGLIRKLRLEFPRSRRRRKYGAVQFDYGQEDREGRSLLREQERGHRGQLGQRGQRGGAGDESDDDGGEEWERHESLHDDVAANRINPTFISQVPGTKERLFEEEQEVTWEKGGSGLVFYTDAQLRKSNDFDINTTDDWDVDTSIYYERGAGDKDARDVLDMRMADRRRLGEDVESVFRAPNKPSEESHKRRKKKKKNVNNEEIGEFAKHTKGFGRRIMEKQGWSDGQGLGHSTKGMTEALHCEGQNSRWGLGYRGERLLPYTRKESRRRRVDIDDVIISTKYDRPSELDPQEPLLRSNPQVYLKHRTK